MSSAPHPDPGLTGIGPAKENLRRAMRECLRRMSPEQRVAESALICGRIREVIRPFGHGTLLTFAPRAAEPDIRSILDAWIAAGGRAALPAFDAGSGSYGARQVRDPGRDLAAGQYGILEPAPDAPVVPLVELDFALVPGLAFDDSGRRLGRGKGYFDRLLALMRGLTCGIGFECQRIPNVPVEPHDVKLNLVITPSVVHDCRGVT